MGWRSAKALLWPLEGMPATSDTKMLNLKTYFLIGLVIGVLMVLMG